MNIPLLIVILYVLLLFCISIYVSYSQKKDSENFLLYKGKNNAFVVAASIAGLAIGGASTIGIAENAFTVGLSAGWYDTAWAIGAVVSSTLAVRYLRRSQYTTISGLVRDLYGTKTSFIMVMPCVSSSQASSPCSTRRAARFWHRFCRIFSRFRAVRSSLS